VATAYDTTLRLAQALSCLPTDDDVAAELNATLASASPAARRALLRPMRRPAVNHITPPRYDWDAQEAGETGGGAPAAFEPPVPLPVGDTGLDEDGTAAEADGAAGTPEHESDQSAMLGHRSWSRPVRSAVNRSWRWMANVGKALASTAMGRGGEDAGVHSQGRMQRHSTLPHAHEYTPPAFSLEHRIADRLMLQCMRGKDAEELRSALAVRRGFMFYSGESYFPVINGLDLADHPMRLIERGQWAREVELLYGHNKDEASVFLLFAYPFVMTENLCVAPHGESWTGWDGGGGRAGGHAASTLV
jgi:hypothetical protein